MKNPEGVARWERRSTDRAKRHSRPAVSPARDAVEETQQETQWESGQNAFFFFFFFFFSLPLPPMFHVVAPDDFAAHPFTRLCRAVETGAGNLPTVVALARALPSLDRAPAPLPPLTPPLVLAAASGAAPTVTRLLALGASPRVRDVRDWGTAALWAAAAASVDTLAALVAVDPDALSALTAVGETALHLAAGAHPEVALDAVSFLIERRPADVKAACASSTTPLHRAASAASPAVVAALLAAGASPGSADAHGDTPVHCASRAGSVDVLSALLNAGADPSALNIERAAPLHVACFWGHMDAARALLATGSVDVGARAARGRTPLHLAAAGDHAVVVAELLACMGVDAGAVDDEGVSVLELARSVGADEVVVLLK